MDILGQVMGLSGILSKTSVRGKPQLRCGTDVDRFIGVVNYKKCPKNENFQNVPESFNYLNWHYIVSKLFLDTPKKT
jgi:hypothetical protein